MSDVRVSPRFVDSSSIRWVLFSRALLGTAMLLAAIIVEVLGFDAALNFKLTPIYLYVVPVYASSLFLAWLAVFREHWAPLAFRSALPLFDLALVTAMAYFTGGATSPFLFLYLLLIVGSAILNDRAAAIAITALAMSVFGSVLLAEHFYGLPTVFTGPTKKLSGSDLLVSAFYNIAAFYLVGILSSYLAERARRADAEADRRSIDLSILRGLHERIVDNVASGLLTLDDGGRILLVNRQAGKILGRGAGELRGRHVSSILPEVRLDPGGSSDHRFEVTYLHPDSAPRTLGYSVSRIRIDVRRVGYILVFQDLTRVKELEAAVVHQAKLAAVGTMAAGLAHELRNPLGAVSGSMQLLRQSERIESEEKELFEIALREIDRLDGLVKDFLLYARPYRNDPSAVAVAEILEEVIEGMGMDVSLPSGVEFHNRIEPGCVIMVDQGALRQIFLNLLRNAVQAGADRIEIRNALLENGVRIDFLDNGSGFTSEAMTRLFEPFFTTKQEGVGLGLAIVYRVMEEFRGTVEVSGRPGETRISLFFPNQAV